MQSKRDLNSAIFNTELDSFCRKYLIKRSIPLSNKEINEAPQYYEEIKLSLFESFTLHNEVNFKVDGENIPLTILINEIGLRGVEELIDDGALSFTVWSPLVLYMNDNQYGVDPLCAGRRNESVFFDPEESIHSGLNFMSNPLRKGEVRALTRKVRDLYFSVPKGMENDSVSVTMSALESGKLERLGLSLKNKDKNNLNESEKQQLISCASDLLGYKYLMQKRAQVSPTSNISTLLEDSMQKATNLSKDEIFSAIIQFENMPDIKTSFRDMGMPMDELVKLRKNKSTKKFRKWMSDLNEISSPIEAQRFYSESNASPRGFFETFWGKSTKSVTMMMIGAYAGSFADTKIGTMLGLFGGLVANNATGYILDMADEYLLSELTKGWTPKLFISELKSLNNKYSL